MAMKPPADEGRDPGRTNRLVRTVSFWALVLLVPLFILQIMNSSRQAETELTYTEFREHLQNENISDVTIIDGKWIEGSLLAPVQKNGQPVSNFTSLLLTSHAFTASSVRFSSV